MGKSQKKRNKRNKHAKALPTSGCPRRRGEQQQTARPTRTPRRQQRAQQTLPKVPAGTKYAWRRKVLKSSGTDESHARDLLERNGQARRARKRCKHENPETRPSEKKKKKKNELNKQGRSIARHACHSGTHTVGAPQKWSPSAGAVPTIARNSFRRVEQNKHDALLVEASSMQRYGGAGGKGTRPGSAVVV